MPSPSDPELTPEQQALQLWNNSHVLPMYGIFNNKASLRVSIHANGPPGLQDITVIPRTIVPYFKTLYSIPQTTPIYWVQFNSFLKIITKFVTTNPLCFERISLTTNTTPQNKGESIINSVGRVVKSQGTLQPWTQLIDELLFDMSKQITHEEFLGQHYLHNFHIDFIFSAACHSSLSFYAPDFRSDFYFPG